MLKKTTLTNNVRPSLEVLEDRQLLSASSLVSIAPGHNGTAFALDNQGHVYQQSPGHAWTDTGVAGKAIAAGSDARGNDEAYIQTSSNHIYRYDQGKLTDTHGSLTSIQAGHGEVFGLDGKGTLWLYNDQSGWKSTGGSGTRFSVGTDVQGKDEVFLLAKNHLLYRYDQGNWSSTGGGLSSFQAGHGEVFGLNGKGTLWMYNDQSGWKSTGGSGTGFSVGTDVQGKDEVFLLAKSHTLYRYDQGKWTSTGGGLSAFQAGHGEVYGLDSKGELWQFSDKTGWQDQHTSNLTFAVGTNAAGNDQLFLAPHAAVSGQTPNNYKVAGQSAARGIWLFQGAGFGGLADSPYYWDIGSNILYSYSYQTRTFTDQARGGSWQQDADGYWSYDGYSWIGYWLEHTISGLYT